MLKDQSVHHTMPRQKSLTLFRQKRRKSAGPISFNKVLNIARRKTGRYDEADNSPQLWNALEQSIIEEHNRKVNANPQLKRAKADFEALPRQMQLNIRKMRPSIPSWWIKPASSRGKHTTQKRRNTLRK